MKRDHAVTLTTSQALPLSLPLPLLPSLSPPKFATAHSATLSHPQASSHAHPNGLRRSSNHGSSSDRGDTPSLSPPSETDERTVILNHDGMDAMTMPQLTSSLKHDLNIDLHHQQHHNSPYGIDQHRASPFVSTSPYLHDDLEALTQRLAAPRAPALVSASTCGSSVFDSGQFDCYCALAGIALPSLDKDADSAPSPFVLSAPPFDLSDYIHSDSKASLEFASMPPMHDFDLFHNMSSVPVSQPSSLQGQVGAHNHAPSPFARHAELDQSLQSPLGMSPLDSPSEYMSPYFASPHDTHPFASPSMPADVLFSPIIDPRGTALPPASQSLITAIVPVPVEPTASPADDDSIAFSVKHEKRAASRRIKIEANADLDALLEDEEDEYVPTMRSTRRAVNPRKRKASGTAVIAASPSAAALPEPTVREGRRAKTDLLRHDEPIQKRNYVGASRTSRKVLPRAIARSLPRNLLNAVHPDANELPADVADAVDKRREQNTRAARESRMRKAQAQAALEQELVDLRQRVIDLETRLARYEGPTKTKRTKL
ncbi:BZ3500_MvSof-1268-A1-R1_Chr2-2g04997 [Microbotryum saponariae]|uniref:BZ3500_MvSof-1268-A1-R1_Chr2-2g04997 protein n=1 Tax=Microbotryum saponariae TaxID=289078 RepID=A0A2X0KN76_9BASI|nr:BZ3500_MvSof-1268-A1-R1_Chr2-2g04997 [Microbotryum saponariae]SDA00670.1 BZ3501_MvSof-1269-A2-R1_Chr2-2g04671 [Microbotryum saponariae]